MSLNPSAAARFCPPPTATPYRKRLSKVPMRARSRSDNYAAVLRLQSTQPKDRRIYTALTGILAERRACTGEPGGYGRRTARQAGNPRDAMGDARTAMIKRLCKGAGFCYNQCYRNKGGSLMEKDTRKDDNRNTYVLQGDESIGSVQIADEVVAMIASLAATEVEGVSAMAGNITNELIGKVGVKSLSKGVKVQVAGNTVKADLALCLEYGYNIPETCSKVQEKVKNAIENMTGLTVTDVNIRIVNVNMEPGN